jgi:hypothetical protein
MKQENCHQKKQITAVIAGPQEIPDRNPQHVGHVQSAILTIVISILIA